MAVFLRKRVFVSWWIFSFAGIVAAPVPGFALTEQVESSPGEVMFAVKRVFQPYGIERSDDAKGQFESAWIYDRCVRERNVLGKVLRKNYLRRARFKIYIEDRAPYTRVSLTARFQYQALKEDGRSGAWRKLKSTAGEFMLEKEFFLKILRAIEEARRAP